MSVLLDAISPQVLQVGLITLPAPTSEVQSREVFARLGTLGYDTYRTLTRGIVIGSSTDGERRLMLTPTSRILELPIPAVGMKEAVRLAIDTVDVLIDVLPQPQYTAIQISLTSHIPVDGESAANAMSRVVLRDPQVLRPLGKGTAAGLRVFLADTASVVIEPYVDEPNTIFVQYVTVTPQETDTISLDPVLRTAIEFQDGPILETLTLLFEAPQ